MKKYILVASFFFGLIFFHEERGEGTRTSGYLLQYYLTFITFPGLLWLVSFHFQISTAIRLFI